MSAYDRPISPAAVFFAYADAPARRAALAAPPGAIERYRLFGLDEVEARGVRVRHNLERRSLPLWARVADRAARGLVQAIGGYGGDFASVLAALRVANSCDVIVATVDRVGIPLVLLGQAGLVRRPIVYIAVGLPERLAQLRGSFARRLYRRALRRSHTIVSYAESEVAWLREWLGSGAPPVRFVPFGVDTDAFRADGAGGPAVDVVSVGADPHRDYDLLFAVAARHPELQFRVVASAGLGSVPANVSLESGLSLEQVRERLAAARVVTLPVVPNSYSGATTVLLQAMALAKPVVVSRTEAIAAGYELEDCLNCRLVEPGDVEAFERATLETLANPGTLGARARETVERSFSWERYTSALWEILAAVCK